MRRSGGAPLATRPRPRHEQPADQHARPVEGEREQDRRHDAGEDLGLDAALEPVGEEAAEALDADDRTDRRQADGAHDTTRTPESSTGPASGSSTPQNRPAVEYPTAVAD